MSLDPIFKIRYKDGDRVQVAIAGNTEMIVSGTIVGLASEHVIDMWIVLLDELLPYKEYPYRAFVAQHTFIRRLGDNKPFLCERPY